MKLPRLPAIFVGLLLLYGGLMPNVLAAQDDASCAQLRQFTFSWPYADACNMQPRGGSTQGGQLTLDDKPHLDWLALQDESLSKFERDRRAILAMAGAYRTSFDFLEVVGYTEGYEPARPYQSWATEYVHVIEDRDDFISLQHIMVMVYQQENGELSKPMVMKHWRQDWQYQKRDLFSYAGDGNFEKQRLPKKEVAGQWAQAVYQVDDSPRYESIGRWEHYPNFSTWISAETWRPLPRRESTVRDDYQVLIGHNRHTIVPTGWVHEENNYKVVLDESGSAAKPTAYLARELGLNRYERIKDFDFSAGFEYWEATAAFWKDVRIAWQNIVEDNKGFHLSEVRDGVPLFAPLFGYAEEVQRTGRYESEAGRKFIEETLERYVRD